MIKKTRQLGKHAAKFQKTKYARKALPPGRKLRTKRVRPPPLAVIPKKEVAQKITQQGSIRLLWWDGMGGRNFGDALSRHIIRAITGQDVVKAKVGRKLVSSGSILNMATSGDTVWGSGLVRPMSVAADLDIRAVRGPLTRREVIKQGYQCPEVYGDPGLLIPQVFDTSGVERVHEVGILPHYVDWTIAKESLPPGAEIINVLLTPVEVIRRIALCKLIYSSSLHGIIAAEALGIPAVWVEFSDEVVGGGFKFRDYYAASGRDAPKPLDWRSDSDPSPSRDAPVIVIPDMEELLAAFPEDKYERSSAAQLPSFSL